MAEGLLGLELDEARRGGRRLPLELWYPAAARHRGQDLDDANARRA